MITGASVRAATAPERQKRLSWRDSRIRQWIVAGVVAGHAQAATLTCIGFFIIDVLRLEPMGAEEPIAIVMMAGAGGTLAAQWGLIPKLGLSPRALIVWGSLIAALGLGITAVSDDLYGWCWLWHRVDRLRLHPAGLHRRCQPGRPSCRGRARWRA
jgi:hypothetical protein